MPKIRRFEDLTSWKKSREMTVFIYSLTNNLAFSKDYGLRQQIQRAAGSTMHNIAEGFDSGTDMEFVRFLKMARHSASEVQSELYLAFDLEYVTLSEQSKGYKMADEVKKLINGLIGYLHSTKNQKSGVIREQIVEYYIDETNTEA